jgi:exodeoxyribonuclease V beta subunit
VTALRSTGFDVAGPLPDGAIALEASAGTGKTWTIAGLVTRYVAEGCADISELLVVTFGRAATGELRTRVRDRLVAARDALLTPSRALASPDPVIALLAGGSEDQVAARRRRLAAALAAFDAATVATIHQFCQQVLQGLGIASDVDPDTALVEDLSDLVEEVCDDLYLRFHCWAGATQPAFSHSAARVVARAAALEDPEARLAPADPQHNSTEDLRVRFATKVREEVERRKQDLRIQGFDDLLGRVRSALADPHSGPLACARLRDRYKVVLVDEFQDTDPVQWEVFRRAFHGSRPLVLIGDPKQAIYAFRGADVRTYLAARELATDEATLTTNWRSDPRLLDGLATVFRTAALGDPRIAVVPVRPGRSRALLGPAADPEPVEIRVLPRTGLPLYRGGLRAPQARSTVAADVADQVVRALRSGATLQPPSGGAPRPLRHGDLAVLVRKKLQADVVRDALLERGVPCVLTGTSSVFATPAADDWVVLLEALDQPHRRRRVRRLALTSWIGWTANDLDVRGLAATDELADTLRRWEEVFLAHGVAGLLAAISRERDLSGRLLHRPDGERELTDRRHVAEALHAEALSGQLGVSGLLSWLRAQVDSAGKDLDQERSRRLDTDGGAVHVVTVHTSKGLEFPVVFLPFGWDTTGGGPREALPRTWDPDGARVRHVGGPTDPGHAAACQAQEDDDAGEELRLLYVAATRAGSRLVVWWAPSWQAGTSPLHRLLFAGDVAQLPREVPVPDDAAARVRLADLAQSGPGGVRLSFVERAQLLGGGPPASAAASGSAALAAARFDRTVDTGWRRTSYTSLTRAAHEPVPAVWSEPEAVEKDDEADDVAGTTDPSAPDPLRGVPSPMADLPGGTAFGTLVHAVLEEARPDPADPMPALRAATESALRRWGGTVSADALAAALVPAVSTPLGPLADDHRWCDLPARDVVPEMTFELPLDGGDEPDAANGGDLRLGAVARLLAEHLPEGDRMTGYAAALGEPALTGQPLRGYLAGSLDAVVRVGPRQRPRYVVVDHKTNRLAGRDEALTAWHYRAEALDAAVIRSHYPLQALLYQVALHRFLRWRQPGYVPEQHLGGVLYLFLRGMCGTAVPTPPGTDPPGVWSWEPPASLVVALSDLLAGGVP